MENILNSYLEQGNTNKGPNPKQGNLEEGKIKRNERWMDKI